MRNFQSCTLLLLKELSKGGSGVQRGLFVATSVASIFSARERNLCPEFYDAGMAVEALPPHCGIRPAFCPMHGPE